MTIPVVPFIDLAKVNAPFSEEISVELARVARSGRYLFGEELERFEAAFAEYCGTRFCVGVANGLDALRLTLQAWVSLELLKPGDEVIVPANSFVASAIAVQQAGLVVRFCDVDAGTFNMTLESVTAAATERTRAIMPVHLFGRIAFDETLAQWCEDKRLMVLEDSAQAHGAKTRGKHAGSLGHAGAFSFYPTKNLGAFGDAGAVVTDDERVAKRVRALGNYGSSRKYEHEWLGINSRMSEIQACVLRSKLRGLDEANASRRRAALRYRSGLAGTRVLVPAEPENPQSHVWHVFAVRVPDRDALSSHLSGIGVETLVHYPKAIPNQPAFVHSPKPRTPVSDRLQHELLSLPISPVIDDQSIDIVIDAVRAW